MTRLLSFFYYSQQQFPPEKQTRAGQTVAPLTGGAGGAGGAGGGWWWVGLKPVRARVQAAGGEDGYSRRLWELDTKLKKGNQNGEEAKGA